MMMLERICYAVPALLHIQPALVLLRPGTLSTLYRLDAQGPLLALLHHRAALFVIVVTACLWAIADPASRRLAVTVIGISMVSFLFVYWHAGAPPELKRIAVADLLGLPFLAFAVWQAFAR